MDHALPAAARAGWSRSHPFGSFFCALDLERRGEWAQRCLHLLHPGGQLVCLVFPIGDFEGGPPYAVRPQQFVGWRVGGGGQVWLQQLARIPAAVSPPDPPHQIH